MLIEDEPRAEPLLKFIDRHAALGSFVKAPYQDRDFVFLAMVPRSGSNYLSSLMDRNGLSMPGEIFRLIQGTFQRELRRLNAQNYEDYVRKKIDEATRDNLFGAKLGWPQFFPLYFSGAYQHYFSEAKFIYLTRERLLDQAISLYIAHDTGYYHSTFVDKKGETERETPFDFDAIKKHLKQLVEMQGEWETFFASEGIKPLRLTYEEVASDPVAALEQIAKFLGRALPAEFEIETQFKKVATDKNAYIRTKYIEEHHQRLEASINRLT